MRFSIVSFLLSALFAGTVAAAETSPPRPIDGVILVIADGTSSELLTATRLWKYGGEGHLEIERLPHTAFVHTHSADNMVTDSSAAATALACGLKVKNGDVGSIDPPAESMIVSAKKAGWSTAILTDDEVEGGTPAPFYAEISGRAHYDGIAGKAITALGASLDLLAGGGRRWFQADFKPKDELAQRQVAANASRLAESPIRQISDWDAFQKVTTLSPPVLATFWDSNAPFYADGGRTLRLADLAEKILTLLQDQPHPFLFVLEAGLPDKACHLNSARRAMTEVLELDETIRRLRAKITDRTLLLVTTDHETGGLAFNGYLPLTSDGDSLLQTNPGTQAPVLSWASGPGRATPPRQPDPLAPDATQPSLISRGSALHTGGDVWLLGQGPGSEAVHGFLDNTEIHRIVLDAITR